MPVYLDTRGNSVLSVAVCDRCNRKFAYVDLMPDPNFPGMRVCKEDLDNFDPWRLPALQTENISLRFPRPDVSVSLPRNLMDTEGAPNTYVQYNNLYIEGTPYGQAGAPGNLDLASQYISAPPPLNPFIYNISPANGPQAGGTLVTIDGANFVNVTNVKFGGVNGTSLSIINANQLTVVTPPYDITGSVDVAIYSTFGIATWHGAFTYT